MKKFIALILAMVVILTGSTIKPSEKVLAATKQLVYKGSSAVEAGDYIYYKKGTSTKTGAQLYRQKVGSSKVQKIARIPYGFFVYGNYIYYPVGQQFYKIKVDGTHKTLIIKKAVVFYTISGNYIYYKKLVNGGYRIYKVDLNGKNQKELATKAGYYGELAVVNDKVYYTTTGSGEYKLYSIDLDGKNKKLITTAKRILDLCADKGNLYFEYNDTTSVDNECIAKLGEEGQIKVMAKITDAIDSSSVDKLYTSMSLKCIKDGTIYFTINSDIEPTNSLIFKRTEDGKIIKLTSCSNTDLPNHTSMSGIGNILVDGDNLCVQILGDDAASNLYTMKTDGTNKKLIATYPVIASVSFVNGVIYFATYTNQDGDGYSTYRVEDCSGN